jgi:hypothetical protein
MTGASQPGIRRLISVLYLRAENARSEIWGGRFFTIVGGTACKWISGDRS